MRQDNSKKKGEQETSAEGPFQEGSCAAGDWEQGKISPTGGHAVGLQLSPGVAIPGLQGTVPALLS